MAKSPRHRDEGDQIEDTGTAGDVKALLSSLALAVVFVGALALFVDWACGKLGLGPIF